MNNATDHVKNALKGAIQFTAARMGSHARPTIKPRLWILMYHRILPRTDSGYQLEEPGMIVEPDTFRKHLRYVKELFTVISLGEWVERHLSGKTVPHNACAITFDDGWLDNYTHAFPILQQEQVPITLFPVSNMIGTNKQFWPNRLAQLLNNKNLNELEDIQWLSPYLKNPFSKTSCTREQSSHIINQLKIHPDQLIHQWISEAEDILKFNPLEAPALMDWEQLEAMSSSDLVEVGSHTCNHYRLKNDLSQDIIESEIKESKVTLEKNLNKPVNLFCYPNGDVSNTAQKLVRANYKAAVTTHKGINKSSNARLFDLLRIGMHEDISNTEDKFKSRLSNWI